MEYAGNPWYLAADEDGLGGGLPRTNIAPGLGFPTGWNVPNVVTTFAGCRDLAIGTYEIGPVIPVERTTWGRIKHMFH